MLRLTLPAIALGVCTVLLHQTQAMDIPSLLNSNNVEPKQQQQRQQQQQQRSQPDAMNIQNLLNSISKEAEPQNDHKGQGRIYELNGESYHEFIAPPKYKSIKLEWKELRGSTFHTEKRAINKKPLLFKCSRPDDYANELMFYRYIKRIDLDFPDRYPIINMAFLKMDGYFSADAAGGCIVFERNATTKDARVVISKEKSPYKKLKLITKTLCALMKIVGFLHSIGVEYNNITFINIMINEVNGDRKRVILTNFQNVLFYNAQRYQHDVRNNQLTRISDQISEREMYNKDTLFMEAIVGSMVFSNSNLPKSGAEIAMLPAGEREAYEAHIALLTQLRKTLYAAAHTGTPKLQGIINTKAFETLWTA